MISLSDTQLKTVMAAAGVLPPDKRGIYLQRVAGYLRGRGGRFFDSDVATAAQAALAGLVQRQPAA